MRTLTTSFEAALKKDMNSEQAFIVKINALKKVGLSAATFYLSNDFNEVDSKLAIGIISDYGAIKESVDFYNGSFSFGGFDINIQQFQDRINDLLSDYYFYNQTIEIYYWIEGQDKLTTANELQLLYTGKIENRITDLTNAKLSVINDTTLLDTMYPPLINDTDAGSAIGKVAQRVYGSHTMGNYGDNDNDGTNDPTNNMVKGIPTATTTGRYRWIVGGNGSDITIAASGALWVKEYGRWMKIVESYYTGTDTQGNKYIEFDRPTGYFALIDDYIFPVGASQSGIYGTWLNTDRAWDEDFDLTDGNDGYTEIAWVTSQLIDKTLTVNFGNIPSYVTTLKTINYGVSNSNSDTWTVSGYGSTGNIDGSNAHGFKLITLADGSLPTEIDFNVEVAGAVAAAGYARVSNCFIKTRWEMPEEKEVYVVTTGTIDTQREIIEDICDDVSLGYTDNTDVTACTLAPVLDTQKKAIEWIKSLAVEGACVPLVNSDNNLKLLKVNLADTLNKQIQKGDIAKLVCSETSLSQVVNDMEIGYKYDNYTNGLTEVSSDSNSSSITIHNETMSKSIVSEYYQVTPTTLLDYYVDGTSETLFSQVRNKIEITTNSILGVLPYTSGGTFNPLIRLEMGDVIGVHPDMDEIQKCNGESWTDKKFIIFGLEIGVGYMKIKGLEL